VRARLALARPPRFYVRTAVDHVTGPDRSPSPVPHLMADRRPVPPHIPSLDGLRAVSFLIVFIAHAGVPGVPGGFGVTVFFFLSGFLITTLMRMERETTGTVNLPQFYLRRVLRILPPFYLILVIAIALTLLGVLPGRLHAPPLLAQSLHFFNYWYIWRGGDGAPYGTVPYWSLAVEEHFYLLFPMLYLAASRRLPRLGQAGLFWGLCAAICVWRSFLVFGIGVPEDRTYMASDTRFDSIFFGCALAIGANPMLDRPRLAEHWWKWLIVPASLGLLIFTFSYRAPWFRESVRYSLQGVALTPIFISAIRYPTWLPYRLLNARPVAFLGVLSYVLYLIHQVVLFALGHQLPNMREAARAPLALVISIVVAVVIHYLVEKPAQNLRKRLTRRATASTASRGITPRSSQSDSVQG
jgi:peptidoglycan/LPS O-acetylase OafA/YrhL